MKNIAKTIVKSPATFIIVVLLLLLTLLVTVRASPLKGSLENPNSSCDIELMDKTAFN